MLESSGFLEKISLEMTGIGSYIVTGAAKPKVNEKSRLPEFIIEPVL